MAIAIGHEGIDVGLHSSELHVGMPVQLQRYGDLVLGKLTGMPNDDPETRRSSFVVVPDRIAADRSGATHIVDLAELESGDSSFSRHPLQADTLPQ